MAAGNTKLEKASLQLKSGTDGGVAKKSLQCRFNPREYSIQKTTDWKRNPTRGAKKAPPVEFVGTGPRTLTLELFLDGWEKGDPDVSKDVETLFSWMNPTPESTRQGKKPHPPVVVFHWGQVALFESCLKSATAKYTMFLGNGTPVRATVSTTFEELPVDFGMQNPTSGSIPGRRTHMFSEGESLQSISYGEYGNANLWRGIAEVNGIDDPLRIPPGRRLLVPPHEEAIARSAVGNGSPP